jgi:EAL domain-containing protein (putative c-di-GMP-specific phosphodiesterase class I)
MTRTAAAKAIDRQFEQLLDERDVRTVFQPIVHLPSGSVVGYEGLIRGPEGSALATADSLISAAERTERLVELDWVARASACREALAAELDTDQMLLLNFEPIALNSDCPSDVWPDIERGFHTFRVVLEVTERSLDRDPGTLLEGIERQRTQVAGIGLDDVGADPSTVAFMPLIGPNVIKVDRSVVQAPPEPKMARIFTAVHEEAERTGAVVLAEGIETIEHRHYALAQGAQIGQGMLLGQPGPLPSPSRRSFERAALRRFAPMSVASPFDVLAGRFDGVGGEDLLLDLTRDLAAYAETSMPSMYVALVPAGRLLVEEEFQRLARMGEAGSFVALLGPDLAVEPGGGVRASDGRQHPLPRDEWAAIAVGPGLSAAVLARRMPDSHEWAYGVTHDPPRVIAAARSLVRFLGVPESPRGL